MYSFIRLFINLDQPQLWFTNKVRVILHIVDDDNNSPSGDWGIFL